MLALFLTISLSTGMNLSRGIRFKVNKNSIQKLACRNINDIAKEVYEQSKQEMIKQDKVEEQKKKRMQIQNIPKTYKIILTFYSVDAEQCGKTDGITASGKHIQEGMCAAPSSINFGKVISLSNGQSYVVEDRGSSKYIRWIDNNTFRIDVYVPSRKQAEKLGVQTYTGIIK